MPNTKAELERTVTVPLSHAWISARHRRTKRAVNILKEYAEKHMKSSEIKIDTELNEKLWDRGIRSPPRRITVKMSKDEDGVVTISLPRAAKAKEEASPENDAADEAEPAPNKDEKVEPQAKRRKPKSKAD
ncbi:MAG: 50S ribosomal protein L31e [Nitrososphaerales archaeon]